MFYQINENEKSKCDKVDENKLSEKIIEGPPAAGCAQDNER